MIYWIAGIIVVLALGLFVMALCSCASKADAIIEEAQRRKDGEK
jgi:hypothetical protein